MRSALVPLALVALLFAAAPAAGNERYAAPTGTGSACTASTPCALAEAIGSAGSTDEIIAAAGTYGSPAVPALPGSVVIPVGATLRGADVGKRRAGVHLGGSLGASGTSALRDLELVIDTTGAALVLTGDAGGDRLVVRQQGTGTACSSSDAARLRNSLCVSRGIAVDGGVSGAPGIVIRNVTGIGQPGIRVGNGGQSGRVVNAIGAGTPTGIVIAGGSPTVDHSASSGGPVGTNPITFPSPFEAPAYRPPASSATIDQGISANLPTGEPDPVGELDLDGNLRVLDGEVDAGAYELVARPPAVVAAQTTGIGDGAATMRAIVDTNGGFTDFYAQWGPVGGAQTSTASGYRTGDVASAALAIPLAGLTPGTAYSYRFVAVSDGGTTVGPEQTFTTTGTAPGSGDAGDAGGSGGSGGPAPAEPPPGGAPPGGNPAPRPAARIALPRPSSRALARVLRSGRVVRVVTRCGERPCAVRLRATVRAGSRTLGRLVTPQRALRVGARGTGRIGVLSTRKLRRAARRAKGKRITLVLRATFVQTGGPTESRAQRVVLRR